MHRCAVCPKSFPSPYKLQRHHVIHTGQKPFACNACGKAFTQSAHLKTHLEKVHRSGLPKESPRDGILTENRPSCVEAAAGIDAHGRSHYNTLPSTAPSSVASRWNPDIGTDEFVHKIGNPPENMPHDGSATSYIVGPVPPERVDFANMDASVKYSPNGYTCKVCFKSFSSPLQLWIHSPTHNKPKQRESDGGWHQISSKTTNSRVRLVLPELTSRKSKVTLKHECPKCLKTFCSPSKLRRHFLIHTGQKPYSCTICWKAFTQKVHLKSHLSVSNKCSLSAGIAQKKQKLCNGSQTSDSQPPSSFQQQPIHRAPVNSSVELELQCKISVNAVQDLKDTEIKSHAVVKPEQPLNSSICHKLNEQEQQHTSRKGLKPFRCGMCSRSFRLEVNLIRHLKIHRDRRESGSPTRVKNINNVKMSNSEAVNRSPDSGIALNIAVKPETWGGINTDYDGALPQDAGWIASAEHQKETLYSTGKQLRMNALHQCHTCSKCFPSSSKLQRHIMTHTGQRPFGCEICGKKFRQKTHLRVHWRTHMWSRYHKQRSMYINRPPSRVGGFNTKMAADVPVRARLLQKKDFQRDSDAVSVPHTDQTSLTSALTNDNREPENKLLLHTSKEKEVVHTGEVSELRVKRTQTAKSKQNTGNVRHKCHQCLKCFPSASKLQRHEMVHTGLKPFHCPVCRKSFRQASHLKTHESTHLKMNPYRPLSQQGIIRKGGAKNQQQIYPRITVRIPSRKKSVNTESPLSSFPLVSYGVNALPCSRRDRSAPEVNSLFKDNSKSNTTCEKTKRHICRICSKNFTSPYKLSRHLVTHSGIRPYRCALCDKAFTQKGHLKVHEQRCRQSNRSSDCIQSEVMHSHQLRDECSENLTDRTDFNVNATTEQQETQHTGVGHYPCIDTDLVYGSEAIDTEWLAVTDVGLKEENFESEEKQRENCNLATDYDSYSFSSELAFEINNIVQNQNMATPLVPHQHEGDARNEEISRQPISESNQVFSGEFESSVVDNQMQPNDYWCEPLTVLECDKCTTSFESELDLKQHICSTHDQFRTTESAHKNHCDICFKTFVSPSKLKRHYLVHTGQRPFRCGICGKAFTQSAHVRTHQLTH
ncbi:zinc finger protein 585A [Embiotoca jacksoni]|uniref:zinc finger protein 585A n=1 Tax=Embiotoca jacksoni TaxID=100190 RepID=UPI003704220F